MIKHSFIQSFLVRSKYLDLMSKPFKRCESRLCPNNKDPDTELQPQTPKHSPPRHLPITAKTNTQNYTDKQFTVFHDKEAVPLSPMIIV